MGKVDDNFYRAVAHGIGVADKHMDAAVDFFRKWQQAEGGSARNNPFNTTYGEPGATNYNSVGVRNYPTEAEGISATVRTLLDGAPAYGYDHIIYALRDGNPAAAAKAVDASSWGTHGLAKLVGSGNDHDADDGPQSGGTTTPPRQPSGSSVAQLQEFLASHGHTPDNSRRGNGWDGIDGPGTTQALNGLLRSGPENVAALQAFLASHGHAPDNSRRHDGSWDGIAGQGTLAAIRALLS